MCSLYVDTRDWGKKNLLFITDPLAAAISLQVYFCKVIAKGMNTFWTLRISYFLILSLFKTEKDWAYLQIILFQSLNLINK